MGLRFTNAPRTEMLPRLGTRVRVHLNLHRAAKGMPDAWSITVGGKNVAYVAYVAIADVTPKYLRTKQAFTCAGNKRTVHAWLEGTLVGYSPQGKRTRVCYNPVTRPDMREFHTPDGKVITHAAHVVFTSDHKAWVVG